MDKSAARLREYLIEAIRPYRDAALLLSGGLDSGTILAAMLALGYRPHLFTVRLSGIVSTDSKVAREMANHFSLPLMEVLIPQNEATLIADIRRLLEIGIDPYRVEIQVTHPFLYLGPAISQAGCQVALHGMGGSESLGDGRKAQIAFHEGGQRAFDNQRNFEVTSPRSTRFGIERVCRLFGVELAAPFLEHKVLQHTLSLTYRDINMPKLKGILLRAFPEFWGARAWYRPPSNMQINARIREWHNTLLASNLNKRKLKDVAGIYRDMKAGLV